MNNRPRFGDKNPTKSTSQNPLTHIVLELTGRRSLLRQCGIPVDKLDDRLLNAAGVFDRCQSTRETVIEMVWLGG